MGYARKDVEATKKYQKKFVRYQEGAEKYSLGLTKFQALAKEAKAVYKIDKVALVNCEIFEKFLKNILKHLESIDQLQRRTPIRYCLLTYCHTKSIICSIGGMKAAMAKMGRPKLPNAKKKVLSIRVSDQLYAQLLAYAEKHKMTTTDVVLRGVETFISRQD